MQGQLQGLKGVKNIADDVIVYGTTREEHDENLDRCLKRLLDRGLRLNRSKGTFLKDTLEFLWQIFSKHGCRHDPKRYVTLKNASQPTNVSEVRSLLGTATYNSKYFRTILTDMKNYIHINVQCQINMNLVFHSSRYIPNFATIAASQRKTQNSSGQKHSKMHITR